MTVAVHLRGCPFAACGFFQYHARNVSSLPGRISSLPLYPKRLLFQSEDLYHAWLEETSFWEKRPGDGAAPLKKKKGK